MIADRTISGRGDRRGCHGLPCAPAPAGGSVAWAPGGGSSPGRADHRRHAPPPQRDPGRRGATSPAGHHCAAAAAPPRPRPVVRSPHAPVIRDGGSTAGRPAPAGQTATRPPPAPLPPPLAVFSQPDAPAAARGAGHGGLRTLGAPPPGRAMSRAGAGLPRRSGARSAAAGFPGAEGIALARPRAAPAASSQRTGFLWHPPGPGRRGSARRPHPDPSSPPGRRGTTFSAPSEKGPAGGVRLSVLTCAGSINPTGNEALAPRPAPDHLVREAPVGNASTPPRARARRAVPKVPKPGPDSTVRRDRGGGLGALADAGRGYGRVGSGVPTAMRAPTSCPAWAAARSALVAALASCACGSSPPTVPT